jgi:hypothetical protein
MQWDRSNSLRERRGEKERGDNRGTPKEGWGMRGREENERGGRKEKRRDRCDECNWSVDEKTSMVE